LLETGSHGFVIPAPARARRAGMTLSSNEVLMKKNLLTAIEITDAHIKLLQAKVVRGGSVISLVSVRPVAGLPAAQAAQAGSTDEEVVRTLKEMTASRAIPTENLIGIIPRRLVILKQMRLPSQNEREIRKMVGLQLVGQIPYSVEDVVYDYEILEKEPSGYGRVLAIALHKEVSRRYLKFFKEAGLNPEKFIPSSFGLLGWLVYQEQRRKISAKEPVLLIDVDAVHSDVCFCHDRKLFFSRNIRYGARDLGADQIKGMMDQIALSVRNYRQEQMGPEVARVVLISASPGAALLREKLEAEMKMPVDIFSPMENILCQKGADLSALSDASGTSFGVVSGALLSDTKKMVNLIPQEVHTVKQTRLKTIEKIKFAVLLGLIFLSGASVFGAQLYQKTAYVRGIEERIAQIAPRIKEAQRTLQFIQTFHQEFQGRILMADLIHELNNLISEDISLRSLHLDEGGRLSLQGYATGGASVSYFQASLVKSSFFKEVNLEYATKRKIFNMELTDFSITARWVSDRHSGRQPPPLF
jgi:Tfp pilus assembly PilM family ATPase/Tfp pilus assembly protein PilN